MQKEIWQISKGIIIFVFGAAFGSGAVFQYLHYTTEREKNKIESMKVSIELHRKINEDFSELIGKMQESEKITNEINQLQSRSESNTEADENKLKEMGRQASRLLEIEQELMNSIISLETKAAELENRSPRKFMFTIVPPPSPSQLKLEP